MQFVKTCNSDDYVVSTLLEILPVTVAPTDSDCSTSLFQPFLRFYLVIVLAVGNYALTMMFQPFLRFYRARRISGVWAELWAFQPFLRFYMTR